MLTTRIRYVVFCHDKFLRLAAGAQWMMTLAHPRPRSAWVGRAFSIAPNEVWEIERLHAFPFNFRISSNRSAMRFSKPRSVGK